MGASGVGFAARGFRHKPRSPTERFHLASFSEQKRICNKAKWRQVSFGLAIAAPGKGHSDTKKFRYQRLPELFDAAFD
jgi:hypothetical protein